MAFESIPQIPSAQDLLDEALKAGRGAKVARRKSDTAESRARKKERERLIKISAHLRSRLSGMVQNFPSVDGLNEFYRELISTSVDLDEMREKLARVDNTAGVIAKLTRQHRGRIEAAESPEEVKSAVGAYIGRVSSVLDRINSTLSWLEQVRKTLRTYPSVKETYTVCIAGFPNVGKSTLLAQLTGASPEVASYAFTTKGLNAGYLRVGHTKVQFIDTPGTLNREKSNHIEVQAELALKYLADLILYVYDPTETYAFSKQEDLRETMDQYGVPVIDYLSKTDIATPEQIASASQEHDFVTKEEFLTELERKAR